MLCRKPHFRRVREIRYSPAYRNDKLIQPFLLATSFARVLHRPLSLPENGGRRETECTLHPRSRVQLRTEDAHTSIQVQAEHPGLPCAVALRLTSCSPRRTALLPPSPPRSFASLGLNASTATSGPHDFAVRSSHTRQLQLSRPPHPTARS